MSLYVHDEEDDPRRPTVTVGTNDEARFAEACVGTRPTPLNDAEARWNFAFWRQNELAVIGHAVRDPGGAALREAWVRGLGLWYEDDDWSDASDEVGFQITAAFVDLCVSLAQELHADGTVVDVFGRPIPVLVHELEYYSEIVEQNLAANPPELVEGLAEWMFEVSQETHRRLLGYFPDLPIDDPRFQGSAAELRRAEENLWRSRDAK